MCEFSKPDGKDLNGVGDGDVHIGIPTGRMDGEPSGGRALDRAPLRAAGIRRGAAEAMRAADARRAIYNKVVGRRGGFWPSRRAVTAFFISRCKLNGVNNL